MILPQLIIKRCCSFLAPADVCQLSQTCREYAFLANDEAVWKEYSPCSSYLTLVAWDRQCVKIYEECFEAVHWLSSAGLGTNHAFFTLLQRQGAMINWRDLFREGLDKSLGQSPAQSPAQSPTKGVGDIEQDLTQAQLDLKLAFAHLAKVGQGIGGINLLYAVVDLTLNVLGTSSFSKEKKE